MMPRSLKEMQMLGKEIEREKERKEVFLYPVFLIMRRAAFEVYKDAGNHPEVLFF